LTQTRRNRPSSGGGSTYMPKSGQRRELTAEKRRYPPWPGTLINRTCSDRERRAPKAGFRPLSKTWLNRGVKIKIHAETGGPSTLIGTGRANPRAGDLSAEKARGSNDLFVMTNQDKEVQKSGLEASASLKRYYRLDEVAAYFAISMRTVYRLLDDGEFHVTRIRGCVRVSLEEIRRYEEAQVRPDQER